MNHLACKCVEVAYSAICGHLTDVEANRPIPNYYTCVSPLRRPRPRTRPSAIVAPLHYRLASANCYGISPTPRLCGLWLFIINVPLFSTANSPEPAGSKEPRPYLCPFHFPFQLSRSSVTRIFQSFIQRFGDFR